METKVNVISAHENELEVTLAYDEITAEIEKAYLEERKTIQMPGFRKGKIPVPMLKKLYGEAIEYKASEKIANQKFWDVVEEQGLKPVSTPKLSDLDFQQGEKLSFKVQYEVIPEIKLKDYTDLGIEMPVFKVKDDDIQKEYEHLIKSHSKYEAAEVVDENSKIVVELTKYDEEKNPIPESASKGITIDLGDEKVNPQIPQNAVGKKTGESFEFSFVNQIPQEDGSSVADEHNYTALITGIEKMIAPEENEELFTHLSQGKAKTKDELIAQIRENYDNYFKSQSDNIYLNGLLSKVVENNPFDVPKGYVETLHHRMMHQEEDRAKQQKMPFDRKTVSEQLKPRAEWNAKWQIVQDNLAAQENITVTDSDLEEIAKEEAQKTGISVDKLLKYYKDSGRSEALLEEKVIEFLKEKNPPVEVDPEEKAKEKETPKGSSKKEDTKGTKKTESGVKKKSSKKDQEDKS